MDVIKKDPKFESKFWSNKKFIEVLITLKDSTKLFLDFILISKILEKLFLNKIPPRTGILVFSASKFDVEFFQKYTF